MDTSFFCALYQIADIPVLSRQEETVKNPPTDFSFSRLARRLAEGLPEPLPLQAAYGRPPHKSRGSSGPTVRPFASGFDGGFCRTQTAHPHHRQPWGWLRGTAPPRTGGRGRSAPFRSRPHGLGGCLKGSPAGGSTHTPPPARRRGR